MVEMFSARQFPICSPCQMKRINQEIPDPEFKKFFDIEPSLYEKSSFLRNIKEAYLRYGSLTDRQKEAFLKAVEDVKKPREPKPLKPIVIEEVEIHSNISMRAQRLEKKAKAAARKLEKEQKQASDKEQKQASDKEQKKNEEKEQKQASNKEKKQKEEKK